MRDGPGRRIIKRIARARYQTDLAITRAIRRFQGQSMFELGGSCRRCGACCETPMIKVYAPLFYLRTFRALMRFWQGRVNGMELIGEDRKAKAFIFRCTHWDPQTRLCDSYASRPGMCWDYPRPLLDWPVPRFLDGCGHRAVHRQAARIRSSLEGLGLSEEKRRELEEKLHARE